MHLSIYLLISTHFAEYPPGTPDVEEGGLEVVSGERGRKSRNFTNSRSTDEELASINEYYMRLYMSDPIYYIYIHLDAILTDAKSRKYIN